VNLAGFVFDTSDLSTIRGGGLLLRRATALKSDVRDNTERATRVQTPLQVAVGLAKGSIQATEVSVGGSVGLFTLDAPCASSVQTLLSDFAAAVQADSALKHATIVADVVPLAGSFQENSQSVTALNRWRQMQEPTLAIPSHNSFVLLKDAVIGEKSLPPDGLSSNNPSSQSRSVGPCEYEGARPATRGVQRLEDDPDGNVRSVAHFVCESTKERFEYGRLERKSRFFEIEAGASSTALFTDDLSQLSINTDMGSLNHKICVIHVDGNDFGKAGREFGLTPTTLRDWDLAVRAFRSEFLKRLFGIMGDGDDRSWHFRPNEHSLPLKRIEVLLWGGDEFEMVVPAWKGWEVLSSFFEASFIHQGRTLTHCAGAVFCHHAAPIHRARRLAGSLTDIAKRANQSTPANRLCAQVLESFDQIDGDVGRHLSERYGSELAASLDANALPAIVQQIEKLKQMLPRRKVHEAAYGTVRSADKTLSKSNQERNRAIAEAATHELIALGGSELQALSTGLAAGRGGGSQPTMSSSLWLHLLEMWDYVAPQPQAAVGGGT